MVVGLFVELTIRKCVMLTFFKDIQTRIWGQNPSPQVIEVPAIPRSVPNVVGAYIVEDDANVCAAIAQILERIHIDSESFPSAESVIAALRRRQPSIIFLDIALYNSDAVEVIRDLSRCSYKGAVQIMSGSDPALMEDVRRIGQRYGLNMQAPISKPFRGDAIRQAIRTANVCGEAELAVDLDEASAKGWLELWYQPKIDLRERVFCGVEGLIRCRHPVLGTTLPGKFLPGASERSLAKLTERVVITALRDWTDFASAGFPVRFAVNTDVSAICNLQFTQLIRDRRPKSEYWPGLILEISEADAIRDAVLMHEVATQLRLYGISFAIDDFGEGYSSFARLREFPFSELKLDQSFVNGCSSDPQKAGICNAVINLAHNFGADAVAEGVEFAADLRTIFMMGCDKGQGYLLGRPMPKAELLDTLRGRERLPPSPDVAFGGSATIN
jgi:EAL domain-containing protein (putative c-di-GMP-specific phosphodiesterase class I)